MFLIHHFEDLITIGLRKHNRGRAIEIKNGEGIERVEIGAKNGAFLRVHCTLLMEELTNTSATSALGNFANVISKDHLRLSDGVIGLGNWGQGSAPLHDSRSWTIRRRQRTSRNSSQTRDRHHQPR